MQIRCYLIFVVVLVAASNPMQVDAGPKTYAFVSVSDRHRIVVYEQDAKSGTLHHLSECELQGTPGSLCTDPQGEYLYAAIRSTESIATLRIDWEGGSLTHVETLPVNLNQTYLSTDRTGSYLFGASYSGGKIAVYRISENHRIAPRPMLVVPTGINAHSIVPDATNRFVFVPHTGPNAIFQFRFDSETGFLSPLSPSQFTTPANTGPRHLKFHPSLPIAYVANEQGCSVSLYRLAESGTLEHLQTLSTLPGDYRGENTCAEVKIHPTGKWVYVSNRGDDSLACFAVGPDAGRLSPIGNVATEKTPRSFDISSDGRFLVAAGQDSGGLALYKISLEDGLPELMERLDVGGNLAWISLVTFD